MAVSNVETTSHQGLCDFHAFYNSVGTLTVWFKVLTPKWPQISKPSQKENVQKDCFTNFLRSTRVERKGLFVEILSLWNGEIDYLQQVLSKTINTKIYGQI